MKLPTVLEPHIVELIDRLIGSGVSPYRAKRLGAAIQTMPPEAQAKYFTPEYGRGGPKAAPSVSVATRRTLARADPFGSDYNPATSPLMNV